MKLAFAYRPGCSSFPAPKVCLSIRLTPPADSPRLQTGFVGWAELVRIAHFPIEKLWFALKVVLPFFP